MPGQTGGRKDGPILFYRTLSATTGDTEKLTNNYMQIKSSSLKMQSTFFHD